MKKYTREQKREICKMYERGTSLQNLQKVLGCSYSTIYYITHPAAYDRHVEYVRYMRITYGNLPRKRRTRVLDVAANPQK